MQNAMKICLNISILSKQITPIPEGARWWYIITVATQKVIPPTALLCPLNGKHSSWGSNAGLPHQMTQILVTPLEKTSSDSENQEELDFWTMKFWTLQLSDQAIMKYLNMILEYLLIHALNAHRCFLIAASIQRSVQLLSFTS